MLHLLPSTVKKEKAETSDAGGPGSSSYKRQKDAKNKTSSSRYALSDQHSPSLFVVFFKFTHEFSGSFQFTQLEHAISWHECSGGCHC